MKAIDVSLNIDMEPLSSIEKVIIVYNIALSTLLQSVPRLKLLNMWNVNFKFTNMNNTFDLKITLWEWKSLAYFFMLDLCIATFAYGNFFVYLICFCSSIRTLLFKSSSDVKYMRERNERMPKSLLSLLDMWTCRVNGQNCINFNAKLKLCFL